MQAKHHTQYMCSAISYTSSALATHSLYMYTVTISSSPLYYMYMHAIFSIHISKLCSLPTVCGRGSENEKNNVCFRDDKQPLQRHI